MRGGVRLARPRGQFWTKDTPLRTKGPINLDATIGEISESQTQDHLVFLEIGVVTGSYSTGTEAHKEVAVAGSNITWLSVASCCTLK